MNSKMNFKMKFKGWQLLLMVIPSILFYFIFAYIPMGGLVLAFENYKFPTGFFSEFVGFDNFKFLFISGDIWKITRNTVLYNLIFVVLNLVLQVTCAIAISEFIGRRFEKVTQSMMFLPYFLSWVVVRAIGYCLFNYEYGVLNTLLTSLGKSPVDIYSSTTAMPIYIVFFNAWKSLGYGTIIYTSAVRGIDQELYEAADIDGANVVQKIRCITLPLLKPTVITMLLLQMSNLVKGSFDMFYNLVGSNSLVYSTTDIIETYVYRALTSTGDVGMAAAAGFYQSILSFVIIMTVNTII